MSASCCSHHSDPQRGNPAFKRVLWIVLAINAVMFLVEIGAGVAAGSASLQADALDFLGDAGNYIIGLAVVGMALRYRAMAAFAKGLTMGAFGLWVIGTVVWHAAIRVMKDSCLAGEVLPRRLLPRQYVEGTALCLRSQQSTKQLRQLLLKRHCASSCR